jgi:hypothetical protein
MEKEFTISGGDLGGLTFTATLDENNECIVEVDGIKYLFRIVDDQAIYCGPTNNGSNLLKIPENDLQTLSE